VKPSPTATSVPIVGIGASAGGLEALEKFLAQVPPGSGLAFVVVQHLDPTVEDLLPELLQRITPMTVLQVLDRVQIRPDCVYVIPPNKDLAVRAGVLHLSVPAAARGLRLPIDHFLQSLAEDLGARSVGVILSGMGADGCQGLRAIRAQGGLGAAQDPASARFDSMPRTVIDAGLAELVGPPEALPAQILAALRERTGFVPAGPDEPVPDDQALLQVAALLRARTGQEFSLYKRNTMVRRIERRMGVHRIRRIQDYVPFLEANPHEVDLLFKELLIGVTSFFRDPPLWTALGEEVLPALFKDRPDGKVFRAWVAGCSTGEEAYSLAMVFREALARVRPALNCSLQIFATDLDRDAIAKARRGQFRPGIAADVGEARLDRFFQAEDGGFRVRKEIREMVVFAPQNVIMDPPFTRLDLLFCRNLLIYLTPELQKKIMRLFHYSLAPGGILCLGTSESVGALADHFLPWGGRHRLFRRSEARLPVQPMIFPPGLAAARPSEPKEAKMTEANLSSLADQVLLQQFAPPAVLINEAGDILYISGRTGRYLEPAAGKANWNIFAMARDGLRMELASALSRAARQDEPVATQVVAVGTNGGTQMVSLTAQRLAAPGPLKGLIMVVFRDQPKPLPGARKAAAGPAGARVRQLQEELLQSREALHGLQEEMQTSQEELKSTNEELQSTNEELQSTNEELTTSKEELQSLNEELQTVNAEQQARMEELTRTSSDMKNLLDSTDIATVFLDQGLNLGRFTSGASRLFPLLPGDVGRPLTDITTILDYGDLRQDARMVLRTLTALEKTVTTRDGRWFSVRIMPYRTQDDRIDGLVLTFTETTTAKLLEGDLRATAGQFQALLDQLSAGFAHCEAIPGAGGAELDGRLVKTNRAFARMLEPGTGPVEGRTLVEVLPAMGPLLGPALAQTAPDGTPHRFAQPLEAGGARFELITYRPAADQFVCIFGDGESAGRLFQASLDDRTPPCSR